MLRDYDTKAAYDADYRLFLAGETVGLAPTTLRLDGNILTDLDGVWTRPLIGGRFRLSLGLEHIETLNRSEVRITAAAGAVYTTDNPRPWPLTDLTTMGEDQVIYVAPGIWCNYLSAALRGDTYKVIDAMIAALGIPAGATVAVVGTGMGWEVERLVDLGFDAVGTETSAWVQSAKTTDEAVDVDVALIAAGYDPMIGEGAVQRARMLAEPRARMPDLVLDEDVTTNPGRNAVKQKAKAKVKASEQMDWGLSIGVMQTLDDAEAVALNDGMLDLATNVAHYVTVLPDVWSGWNGKSAAGWKALLTPALILPHGVASAGYTVI